MGTQLVSGKTEVKDEHQDVQQLILRTRKPWKLSVFSCLNNSPEMLQPLYRDCWSEIPKQSFEHLTSALYVLHKAVILIYSHSDMHVCTHTHTHQKTTVHPSQHRLQP